jgi:flagellar protein FliJ
LRQLETLIKMHKLYVDEQRRVLAEKQMEADAITMAIVTLQTNMELEKEKAAEKQTEDSAFVFGAYIRDQLKRHLQLQRNLSIIERDVEKERDKLSLMFEELKRYETAQKTFEEEQRLAASKREDKLYDEQSSQRHHQKKE